MAEEIKRVLKYCSNSPMDKRFCISMSRLSEIIEELKELDYKSLEDVYNYAKNLDLPEEFKEELKFEYEKRGFKS
ncbi:MAG: hypothetical protein V1818_01845 [Candidatus Aenigmatarchaeota archaeon]